MATSPDTSAEHSLDFRAPPPSPIANQSGRRSSVVNDDEISEFLQHCLRVPDLILPGRIFPRETPVTIPPEIDLQSLISSENDSISKTRESIASIGCFQLVNHGIPGDMIRSVSTAAAGIFQLPSKSKAIMSRSPENRYGFEEFYGEEETETSEEFMWCRDEGLKSIMEGIWAEGYSNFSLKMDDLAKELEKIAQRVLLVLSENDPTLNRVAANVVHGQEADPHGLFCCLYKHCQNIPVSQRANYLKSDIIRMLIRGSDYSHALCLHICDCLSEFLLYSKKGWITFSPNKDVIVVTTGDQIQAWTGGQYKNVIGRPIFKVEDQDPLSMSFLYSPSVITQSCKGNKEKTISVRQQFMFALFLTLLYHISVCIYMKF